MSEASFCTQCGAKLTGGAKFCVECGWQASGTKILRSGSTLLGRYAPLLVLGAVLVVSGAAVSIGLLNPKTPPSVPGRQGGRAGNGVMPEGHPPISVPDDVRQVIDDLAASAAAEPDNLALWEKLAEAQYQAGRIERDYLLRAKESLLHILERDADNTDVLRRLGIIAFDRQQHDEAIDYYSRYLSIKPDDHNVRTDRATMQLSLGRTDDAIAGYQQVLAENPEFFQAQLNLGIAYQRAGRQEQATAALQRARELAADENARERVAEILAHVQGASASGGSRPNETLRAGIERFFRSHQIIGPKIDRFEWDGDRMVRVVLSEFPLDTIPEFAREQLNNRIRSQIKQQKASHQTTETVQVELVDGATDEVMATISE
jgi:hypothetical protein